MKKYLPHTPGNAARVVYPDELVICGNCMKVRGFFVYEERIRHPNVFDKFGADGQLLDTRLFLECESRVGPELTEVKIKREVLFQ